MGSDNSQSQTLDLIQSNCLSTHSLIETNLNQSQLNVTDSNHALSTLDHEVDPSIINIGLVIGPNIDNSSFLPLLSLFQTLYLLHIFGTRLRHPKQSLFPLVLIGSSTKECGPLSLFLS